MKQETIYNALEAMKEQDAVLNEQPVKSKLSVMMSIETYEQMQNDPKVAEDILNRISSHPNDALSDAKEYLKKW